MRIRIITGLMLTLVIALRAGGAEPLVFSPVELKTGDGQNVDGVEFGHLSVLETRVQPGGKRIKLAVWRLRRSGEPLTALQGASPIVYLHGGPGGDCAGLLRNAGAIKAITALRRHADVILLDQRGCGRSEPSLRTSVTLGVAPDALLTRDSLLRHVEERSRMALDELKQQGLDLRGYNTIESADDLNDLRLALGAKKISLWGYSYGTHLALCAIRRHGQIIDRAILCGVEGPDATYKLPDDVHAQFRRIGELCKANPSIAPDVPDLLAMIKEGAARLDRQPAVITVTHPQTKQKMQLKVGGFAFQLIVAKLYLGRTEDISYLPRVVYSAAKGDGAHLRWGVQKLCAAALPVASFVVDSASGVSSERAARIAAQAPACVVGDAANFPLPLINESVFRVPVLGDDYRAPLSSDVPVLMISGALDGHTPPHRAEERRNGLPNAMHLIVENGGHDDVISAPGLGDSMVDFLRGADVSKRQLSVPPIPFQSIMK